MCYISNNSIINQIVSIFCVKMIELRFSKKMHECVQERRSKCRLHKLTPTDIRTEPRTEPGVSREAPPLKIARHIIISNFPKILLEAEPL